MKSVYISKSNQAPPDDIINLRGTLGLHKVPISEYMGGKYSAHHIVEADVFVCVPPLAQNDCDRQDLIDSPSLITDTIEFNLGKGIFTEYVTAKNHGKPAYFYYACAFYEVQGSVEKSDVDWQTDYVRIEGERITDKEFLEQVAVHQADASTEKTDNAKMML